MRTFLTTAKNKITMEMFSLTVATLLSIVSISSVVLAYGPARPTFTQANPANYVTFDSITDDPNYGDERDFYRVRDISTSQTFGDSESLTAGKTYEAQIFFHNNAASNLNDSGVGIAQGVSTRADMPAIVKAGATDTESNAYINASNASPASIYDDISFSNPSNADIALRLVPGSVTFHSYGPLDGQKLSDTTLFSSAGQPLGFDSLNGVLPGCSHYSGYITYQFTAEQPNFTFAKDVRVDGTSNWQNQATVSNGATVDYRLAYDNVGQTQQNDVTLEDTLPAGLTYVPGSTELDNDASPNGEQLADGITTGKVDIGSYTANANAYLYFKATVNAAPCTVLTNTAYAITNNGNSSATATLTVAGNCTAALPHTGPAQVVAGLIGIGAITFGVVYYLKSRRELEYALLHTQAHPTLKTNLISAPDTTTVEDVEADHKHKKSEHKK